MNNIPEFWRTEIWHPLSVHFPIALLVISTLFCIISLFLPVQKRIFWENSSSLILLLGVITTWLAIFTGDLADGVVSRKLCDPTVLKDHENAAYISSYLFTAALVWDVAFRWKLSQYIKPITKRIFLILLLLVGSGFLIQAGHLGASLVYQQAAGVYQPSEDCKEFE